MLGRSLLLMCTVVVAGCSGDNLPDGRLIQLPPGDTIAETVNGIAVPQSLLEAFARQHNLHLDRPQQRDQALNLLTDTVLVAQAAQNADFARDPQFLADAEAARLKGIADASVAALQKQTPITDEMLKAEYDAQTARTGALVYDFSQLLFADEATALQAQGDLLGGKSFAQVFDAWRSKAKQAKAFTRVHLDQVPAPMAEALVALKNGETTKVPVKTEFGWHIVRLDIVNPYTPPAFEQIKEGIRHSLQVKIGQERMKKLREQARVEYPAGSAPPAQVAAPQPNTPAAPVPAEGKKDEETVGAAGRRG
jgi:peptidyl-prolyl cis-trans isomerase C